MYLIKLIETGGWHFVVALGLILAFLFLGKMISSLYACHKGLHAMDTLAESLKRIHPKMIYWIYPTSWGTRDYADVLRIITDLVEAEIAQRHNRKDTLKIDPPPGYRKAD